MDELRAVIQDMNDLRQQNMVLRAILLQMEDRLRKLEHKTEGLMRC